MQAVGSGQFRVCRDNGANRTVGNRGVQVSLRFLVRQPEGWGWRSPEMGNSGGQPALQRVRVSSLAVQAEVVHRSFFSEKETRVGGRGWAG